MLHLPIFRHPTSEDLVLGRQRGTTFSKLYWIGPDVRALHMYVVGVSGKGKSKLLEFCLFQDIASGRGCGLIDPHSLLADDLLRHLLTKGRLVDPAIRQRIIYLDPAREDYVIPFNVLAAQGEQPYDIAAQVLEAFRRTWPQSLKEAPHFANVMMAALLVLIANKLTLIDMPRLLTNQDFREQCLRQVTDPGVIEFFHDRYDRWGKEAPLLRESTLNKIGAFALNPRLKLMLGQKENHLDFRRIMDEGKILLVDLGRCDEETNHLIGSLIVTGLEMAMRRRENRKLWNLTIDEFTGYVANAGSAKTLSHVFSEGRKYKMSITVAQQTLSQMSDVMLGALSNVRTKVIFEVGRYDAEYLAKLVGKVNPEEVKRDPKTASQYELFASLFEQWESWIDMLRFQPDRAAIVTMPDGGVLRLITIPIPRYTASETDIEVVRRESLARYGIPYAEVEKGIQPFIGAATQAESVIKGPVPEYEILSEE
jgi:hypothetical protein